jgi:MFS family permease
MRVHLDILAWLHFLTGAFGALTGTSLAVLASGTHAAALAGIAGPLAGPATWLLAATSLTLIVGGLLIMAVGRLILARAPRGRRAALMAAVVLLVIPPFGTALAIYTCWTLVNDDARRSFGQSPLAPDTIRI